MKLIKNIPSSAFIKTDSNYHDLLYFHKRYSVKNTMKKCTLILVGLSFACFLWAQKNEREDSSSFKPIHRQSVSISTGYSNFGSGYSFSSVNPSFLYQASPKLILNYGAYFTNISSLGGEMRMSQMNTAGFNMMPDIGHSTSLYMQGAYKVGPKLTIGGGGYKEFSNSNPVPRNTQMNNTTANKFANDQYGMNMFLEYKLGSKMKLQAIFHFTNGSNPYRAYSNSYYGNSLLNNDPFYNNYSGFDNNWP